MTQAKVAGLVEWRRLEAGRWACRVTPTKTPGDGLTRVIPPAGARRVKVVLDCGDTPMEPIFVMGGEAEVQVAGDATQASVYVDSRDSIYIYRLRAGELVADAHAMGGANQLEANLVHFAAPTVRAAVVKAPYVTLTGRHLSLRAAPDMKECALQGQTVHVESCSGTLHIEADKVTLHNIHADSDVAVYDGDVEMEDMDAKDYLRCKNWKPIEKRGKYVAEQGRLLHSPMVSAL